MSGELVARLRRVAEVTERHDQAKAEPKLLREAADRIEELEREVASRISIEEHAAADHEAAYAGAAALVRIERMEAVVAAARAVRDFLDASTDPAGIELAVLYSPAEGLRRAAEGIERRDRAIFALRAALAALDEKDDATLSAVQINRPTRADNARPCPSAVSFCGGPDRYGDTCAACLATWTEEAKEKAK